MKTQTVVQPTVIIVNPHTGEAYTESFYNFKEVLALLKSNLIKSVVCRTDENEDFEAISLVNKVESCIAEKQMKEHPEQFVEVNTNYNDVPFEEIQAYAMSLINEEEQQKAEAVQAEVSETSEQTEQTEQTQVILKSANKKKLSRSAMKVSTKSTTYEEQTKAGEVKIILEPYEYHGLSRSEVQASFKKKKTTLPTLALPSPKGKKNELTDEILAARYQSGDEESATLLFNKYKIKIANHARKKAFDEYRAQELEEEIYITFSNCLKRFDTKSGVKFKTYFWNSAQHATLGYFNKMNTKKRCNDSKTPELSLYATFNDSDTCIIDTIADERTELTERAILLREVIKNKILPHLDEKEKEIVNLMLSGYDKGEIFKFVGITRAGVYNRIKKIKEKLMRVFTPHQIQELMC